MALEAGLVHDAEVDRNSRWELEGELDGEGWSRRAVAQFREADFMLARRKRPAEHRCL